VGSSDGQASAPAAWYGDPTGRHQYRYWDGKAWTEHVADNGEGSIDPLEQQTGEGGGQSPSSSEEFASLLRELEASTYAGRLAAAAALGELDDPAALPALERMSRGTDDLWVLFDEDMRARARITYPSGLIPGADQEILWVQLAGTNDQLKRAAQMAIARIQATGGTADPVAAAMKVLNDAYLVQHDPELLEAVAKALDEVHASPDGLTRLLDRLSEGVVMEGNRIQLADWGDMTWNELLKKREVVKCLQRAKDGGAVEELGALLQAECSYGQWADIVQPAIARALGDVGTEEAAEALKSALSSPHLPLDSARAIQEALAERDPGAPSTDNTPDISTRTGTERVGCIGFRVKDPARSPELEGQLHAIAATTSGDLARIDAIFGLLDPECSVEHQYVYEATFASAWAQLDADVAMVVDFEARWDQFLSKLRTQRYDSEPAAVRAMAVNARALELTVQFVSRPGDVLVTL